VIAPWVSRVNLTRVSLVSSKHRCPLATFAEAVGHPPRVSRKGKAPPLERGRGRRSSPANPGRVSARASERGDNGVYLSKT
jgi:hypothetical protein